jgi:CheY-like chemotaxis protein
MCYGFEFLQGKDVLLSLRAKGASLPTVVAMTANTTPEDLASYAKAGFSATLSKPFTQANLNTTLGDALKERIYSDQ